MEQHTMVKCSMAKSMDLEPKYTQTQMELNIPEIGKMISNMVREMKLGLMDQDIKEPSRKE